MSDESKFDTMRLIAGVEASDAFTVEDILQEFDPEYNAKAAQDAALEKEAESAPDVEETASEPAVDTLETDGDAAAEDQEPEEPEPQSESEIADAIAEAIAASFQPSDRQKEPVKAAKKEPIASSKPSPEAPQKPASAPEAPQKEPVTQSPELNPQNHVPNVKTVQEQSGKKEQSKKPKKIPKSHVHVGITESLGLMVGDLRSRQRAALPPNKASLKSAEKTNAVFTKIGTFLTPVRYIVLVLMVLALAGRRFHWMLLGFLGGTTGVTFALIAVIAAIAVGWQSVLKGLRDVFYLRGSYETILLITTVLSILDTLATKNEATLLPLLAIAWCVSGTSSLMTTRGNLRSLRTVITGRTRTGVRVAPNKWENTDCIGKASASTTGYVRRQEENDAFHGGWSVYGWVLLALSLILGAYLSARTEGSYLSILATLLTVSLPVSLVLSCARPYELLTRVLGGKAAVAGWAGLKSMSGSKAALIYDSDLFPSGTITHKGVRVYGRQTPRLLVSYASSLVLRADNGLGEVFTKLLKETDGQIYDVSYFQIMESGLLGRIHGVPVAVGTYNFMQLMGSMPPAKAPKNGIYISLNGEVAGVFAIQYRVLGGADDAFERLVRDRSLSLLIATRNFCVNPSFIENWFHAPVESVTCPKAELRRSLSEPATLLRGTTCGYVMKDGITVYSRLVSCGRRVHRVGVFLSGLSVAVSLVMFIRTVLQIAAGAAIMGGVQLLLLQLVLLLVVELAARFSVK